MEIVNDYMLIRPFCEGPFLVHLDESPLTRYQLKSVLKKCLRKLGLHLLNFTSHCFRLVRRPKLQRWALKMPLLKNRAGGILADFNCMSYLISLFNFIGGRRCIWILGHSFIFWANKRARKRCYTPNLLLDSEEFRVTFIDLN